MLGRNGSSWAYDEMVVMRNAEEAEGAFNALTAGLSDQLDYKNGRVRLELFTDICDLPILRLYHDWKTSNIYRLVTDGSRIGINVRPKKTPYSQEYSDSGAVVLGGETE